MSDSGADADLGWNKLAAARLWATSHYPYMASAVFASPTIPAPELGRLVIDRWWRVHADPAVVEQASVPELGGELLHLVTHLLRGHADRADAVELKEQVEVHHWVDAADAEITDDFPASLERVSPAVSPEDLACEDGRFAEEYYRRGVVRDDSDSDCGSGAHGWSPGWEPPPPSSPSDSGVGEDDQELLRRQVASDIAKASADAVSSGLRTWAEEHLSAQVDWRSELAALIRRSLASVSGAVDYSYRRPSRRASISSSVVLPSLHRPAVEVAVVCDTSASVTEEQLGLAVTEIDGMLRATGTRSVQVLSVDTAVHTVTRATRGRDISLIGGGGTDLTVGLAAALDCRPRPQVVVVVTDGFTPWPEEPPRADVIVVLLDSEGFLPPPPVPEWARTVRVGSEGR